MKNIYYNLRWIAVSLAIMFLFEGSLVGAAVKKMPLIPKKESSSAAVKPAPPTIVLSEEEKFVALVEKSLPGVVSIVGSRQSQSGAKEIISRGTGFVVDPKGLLLTNRHVVSQDNVTYTVFFPDGSKYTATVLGRDPLNDLAIIKIPGDNFLALPLGNSDEIRIGQTVITIGNSLGRYSNTVTRGIVSGLGRSVAASDNITGQTETLDDVIQTDAAINLGNSGGPLLNSKGEVLGINTAIEQSGRGVGFAIPVNEGKKALELYRRNGRIVRPYLGVRYITITSDIQDERKLARDYGALISAGDTPNGPAVIPGSPASKAGIREGDIIIAVNGTLVRGRSTLLKLIQNMKPGDFATLLIARGNNVVTLEATLAEVPAASALPQP